MTPVSREDALAAQVCAVVTKFGMIRRGDGIVVGVSGGPDSVALLRVLHALKSELGFWMIIAHLDHRLRSNSVQDADFVRDLAKDLDIEIKVKATDVRQLAQDRDMSIEEAGRRARYDFFEQVRASAAADTIATAHHLDDQVETFFLRIFRGSTLKGLGGIPPVRGRIIRPLIEESREEILSFLEDHEIPFRLDSSNLTCETDRNFIRNRLIPVIRERFPDFRGPMSRTMDLLGQEDEFLTGLASDLRSQAIRQSGKKITLDIPDLCDAPGVIASRAILQGLYSISGPTVRWARTHVDIILNIARGGNPSAEISLPGGIVLTREYDTLTFAKGRPEPSDPFFLEVTGPGEILVPSTGMIVTFQVVEKPLNAISDLHQVDEAYFDADHVGFPLVVRSPLPGDRFRPWGLEGSRKLKKVLIEHKVPRQARRQVPLIEKDKIILWIPGIRRGQAAPIGPRTRRVLKVSVTGDTNWANADWTRPDLP
jgi:tRNA(Ile)-lysidine synthase